MLSPHGDPLGRIGDPDIGGQCVYIKELARHLADCGCGIRVYTRDRSDGKPSVESFAANAQVIRVPCGPSGFVPKEQILPHLDEFADRIANEVAGAAVIHSHYWDGAYVARKLRRRQRWFHTTHSLGMLKRRALPDAAKYAYDDRIRIETEAYRTCDRVVALTDLEKRQIVELYGVDEQRILVISPGVDPLTFTIPADPAAVRRRLGLPDGQIVFTLGRLDERKGFDLFLRAAGELLRHRNGLDPYFVLSAGAHSEPEKEEMQRLERIATEERLGDRLIWLDILPTDAVPDYYAAANVFALPSRYEPFGIVMLEAMASGVPVAATREGGPSKVIEHGVDGLLVDPTNTPEFAGAMATILRSHELGEQFRSRGRAKVESTYGWPRIAEQHLAAYDLAGDPPEGGARAR
jgi:glycosyltransferase involved in cell wall biosynthesis